MRKPISIDFKNSKRFPSPGTGKSKKLDEVIEKKKNDLKEDTKVFKSK